MQAAFICLQLVTLSLVFFFNDTATTEIYTLSLHDALPICCSTGPTSSSCGCWAAGGPGRDRKSTRLNSSHDQISYAVFCLKKKNKRTNQRTQQTIGLHVALHSLSITQH